MRKVALDAKAGEVSAELARRGVAAEARVRALVEVVGEAADLSPVAAVAEAGGAFDWLAGEPDLYSDADLARQRRAGGCSPLAARRSRPRLTRGPRTPPARG